MKSKKTIVFIIALLAGGAFFFLKSSDENQQQQELKSIVKKQLETDKKQKKESQISDSDKQQLRNVIIETGMDQVEKNILKINQKDPLAPGIDYSNIQGKLSTGSFIIKDGKTTFLDPVYNRIIQIDKNGKGKELFVAEDTFVKGLALDDEGNPVVFTNNKGDMQIITFDKDGKKKSTKIKSDKDRINYYLNTSEVVHINGESYIEIASEYYKVSGDQLVKVPGKPSVDGDFFLTPSKDIRNIGIYDIDGNNMNTIQLQKKYDSIKNLHTDINKNIYIEFDHVLTAVLENGDRVATRQLVIEKYDFRGKKLKQIFLDREEDLDMEYDVNIDKYGNVYQHLFNSETNQFEFKKINF